jgi:hypothetical protein
VSYVIGFSPWITYGVLSSVANWRTGVIAAFALQAVLTVALARRRQLDLLSVGALLFFGVMTVIAIAAPHSSVHRWMPALAPGALALIAGVSLLVGRPFTLAFAKRTTPRELWSHPRFIAINRFLTAVWTASFAASAVVCAVLIGAGDSSSVGIVNVVAFVVSLVVTHRTVARAQAARAQAAAHA